MSTPHINAAPGAFANAVAQREALVKSKDSNVPGTAGTWSPIGQGPLIVNVVIGMSNRQIHNATVAGAGELAGGGGIRILAELLDAQRDALLLDVDIEHLRLDHLALLEVAAGAAFFAGAAALATTFCF